jgi:hypothetical protein
MKLRQVGAQLYTVREHLKTPRQFVQTIDRLKGIGYCAAGRILGAVRRDEPGEPGP